MIQHLVRYKPTSVNFSSFYFNKCSALTIDAKAAAISVFPNPCWSPIINNVFRRYFFCHWPHLLQTSISITQSYGKQIFFASFWPMMTYQFANQFLLVSYFLSIYQFYSRPLILQQLILWFVLNTNICWQTFNLLLQSSTAVKSLPYFLTLFLAASAKFPPDRIAKMPSHLLNQLLLIRRPLAFHLCS